MSRLSSTISGKVLLERDWLVIVSKCNAEEKNRSSIEKEGQDVNQDLSYHSDYNKTNQECLAEINSKVVTIDMTMSLVSSLPPLVLWDYVGIKIVLFSVAAWNVFSCVFEISCMYKISLLCEDLLKAPKREKNYELTDVKNRSFRVNGSRFIVI